MNEEDIKTQDPLTAIGERLHTQDNRCTQNPMFCVQVLERLGPIMLEYGTGEYCYHDHEDMTTYYKDGPDPEEWERLDSLYNNHKLPEGYTASSYQDVWKTVQVCFTEQGCKDYLKLDGHNLRYGFGTRIYVESFNRNPEMIRIRESLMEHAPAVVQEQPAPTKMSLRAYLIIQVMMLICAGAVVPALATHSALLAVIGALALAGILLLYHSVYVRSNREYNEYQQKTKEQRT